ncbi:(R)-stereoselective amidase [Roseovarius sp. A-2]|uniref:nitrilase-related carbon-nitrogen hydrolase n=1 Tax=Roseovarius sp. A-2 TaxID=1570360 RepID=UPI0009B590BC|nr:nitrilase-related carbon-nitrogen hydrolase [Roseovarius sp. A-2]GAW35367.1 (R)-stereoselective amidase [Roseovarius sp. A-2]
MRLGVYQCDAAGRTPEARLTVLDRLLTGRSLDLLVCPELFLSGYDAGEAHERLAEEPETGPFASGIKALAKRHSTAIAYGYPERGDGVLFNAAALVDARGALLANHRKRLPSPGSFEESAFANGEAVTFADLGGWRLAMLICYEVEFPESLRQAALGGADLVIVPTALGADWGVVAEQVVPTRAFENGLWLAYAGHAGEENGARYYGGSRIADPLGHVLADAGQAETVIEAELSRDAATAARARLPYLRDCARL